MKRIVSMLILALMTSCSQPNVTVTMSATPDKVQSSNQPPNKNTIKVETNKTIIDENNKINTQITNESKIVVETDANLGVKIDGTGAGTIAQSTPTPQPTILTINWFAFFY